VSAWAADLFEHAGLADELRKVRNIDLVDNAASADVIVAVAHADLAGQVTRSTRLVLVADDSRLADLSAVVDQGLGVLVPRREATASRLSLAVTDAYARADDLTSTQVRHVTDNLSNYRAEPLPRFNKAQHGLTQREVGILWLLAEGMDTGAIAETLGYSERTVKNVLHHLLARHGLRNRTHAVAYGLRNRLI
jgi:DNA-binding NarL/FixJ family response regulator